MDDKLTLKHGELGGLKENAEALWNVMLQEIKKNGYSDATLVMEGTARAIFEIIKLNNIVEAVVSYQEIEEAVDEVYNNNFKIGDVVKHADAAYSEDFTIIKVYKDGLSFLIQGPKPKYEEPFFVYIEKLLKA